MNLIIKTLFERRQFTDKERAVMKELYKQTEMLAHRMWELLPKCEFTEQAVFRLKDVMASCETALAIYPERGEDAHQIPMPFAAGEPKVPLMSDYLNVRELEDRATKLRAEAAELDRKCREWRRINGIG
jgi:hypothetical protein